MDLRSFLPFQQATRGRPKKVQHVAAPGEANALARVFKVASLALGWQGSTGAWAKQAFEINPYDFMRILQAIDTDAILRMGFSKYKELMWKEGWQLNGSNKDAVEYIYKRFDFMEATMKRPFNDFLNDVGDQLVKFSNCYVVKSRGHLNPYFPTPLKSTNGSDRVVVGYYIVPAETMEIARDLNNNPLQYRQLIMGAGTPPTWEPEEIVHFVMDRKPGRAFGTPFLYSVLEDVTALRQIEEDIQNLVHRELFPLYKYSVGTETSPAQPEEIDYAAKMLTSLRTDGGLVLPGDRHNVEVIGAEGHVLEAHGYLEYFRGRMIAGLGLSEHHLGIMSEKTSKAVTDRLDIALYDRIKMFQRYLEDMIRIHIINELLFEGGFDPFNGDTEDETDKVIFKMREIDVDTAVKKDNQVIQKYAANLITSAEARYELSDYYDLDVNEHELSAALMARMAPPAVSTEKTVSGSSKPSIVDTTPPAAIPPPDNSNKGSVSKKAPGMATVPKAGGGKGVPVRSGAPKNADNARSSTGGRPNPSNVTRKTAGNVSRPSNQHVKRTSPNIRHMDDELLNEIVELIDESEDSGESV